MSSSYLLLSLLLITLTLSLLHTSAESRTVNLKIKRKHKVGYFLNNNVKILIGALYIDNNYFSKTWEVESNALPKSTSANPFYSMTKVFSYEGKPQCSTYDCLRSGINSQGEEVLTIPFYAMALTSWFTRDIGIGTSVQMTGGKAVAMLNSAQSYSSLMSRVGSDCESGNVQLEIVEDFS